MSQLGLISGLETLLSRLSLSGNLGPQVFFLGDAEIGKQIGAIPLVFQKSVFLPQEYSSPRRVEVMDITSCFSSKQGQYIVEKLPKMSEKLFGLKLKVHSFLLEQLFMKKLCPTIKLQVAFEMQARLKEKGFTFEYTGENNFVGMPPLREDTPLPILKLLCRIEKITHEMSIQNDFSKVDMLDSVAFDAVILKNKYPESGEIVDNFLLYLKYAQLKIEFQKTWDETDLMYSGVRKYLSDYPNVVFSPGTRQILQVDEDIRKQLRMVKEYKRTDGSNGLEDTSVLQERSTMYAQVQLQYCRDVIRFLRQYQEEMSLRQKEYEVVLRETKELSRKEFGSSSYVKICTESERHVWASLFVDPQKFGQFVIDKDGDVRETSASLKKLPKKRKTKHLSQEKKVAVASETVLKKKKLKKAHQDRDEEIAESFVQREEVYPNNLKNREFSDAERPRFEFEKTGSLLDIGVVFSDSKKGCSVKEKTDSSSCLGIPPKDLREAAADDLVVKGPDAASTVPEAVFSKKKKKKIKKIKPTCAQIGHPFFDRILLKAGPNHSLEYTWHVRRWEKNSGFDPITQDPEYIHETFSEEVAQKMRFRHSFGRALDPLILNMAKPFIKKGEVGVVMRRNFCLLGEIQFSVQDRMLGIFRVTLGVDNKIIHKFFTCMSPSALLEKYRREGIFAIDAETSELQLPGGDTEGCGNYTLPDDGSRVVHVCRDCVQVRCQGGEILTVDPFSDI